MLPVVAMTIPVWMPMRNRSEDGAMACASPRSFFNCDLALRSGRQLTVDGQRCQHRSFGVILVGCGHTEHRQHCIADVFLDGSP